MMIYAAHPSYSRGRLHPTLSTNGRDDYQRDRDRIIHSKAFRRLAHKTQVFVYYEGDHYRNRLTHSLEVAQISRACARILGVNEDLAETTALAHDLGHPPFGHAGEDALNEVMKNYGGYDHNAQALRIVTLLEDRYPQHQGLNLTLESLEGILKHNGPITGDIPRAILAFPDYQKLNLNLYAGIEAQIAAECDDIAYNAHDIDDGLRAELFKLSDLEQFDFCAEIMNDIHKDYPSCHAYAFKHEFIRRMISYFVSDLIAQTKLNIANANPQSYHDVCQMGYPLVAFSETGEKHKKELKKYLFENMYHHYKILRMTSKASRVIKGLFNLYMQEPEIIPFDYTKFDCKTLKSDEKQRAILIADFIAGMTDKFALEEYKKLFELVSEQL